MKTTSELNRKWWYRLLKVLYTLFAIFVVIIAILLIFDTTQASFDDKASYVKCDDGRQFPVDKIGMYSDYVGLDNDKSFRFWCATTITDGVDGKKKYVYNDGVAPSTKNYTFIAKDKPRDWPATIGYSLLSVLAVVAITEIIRRIFYYIILGSINPKRQ